MSAHFVQVREHVPSDGKETKVPTVTGVRDASLFALFLDDGNHLRVQVVRATREQVVLDLQIQPAGEKAPEAVAPGRGSFDLPRAPVILRGFARPRLSIA